MPITPTYPGVYVEEVPSGVRAITGVATSIAAFVGFFSRGPLDKARRILSFADFEREFGGLHPESLASYAIYQFFLNGGQQAWVVRTAKDTASAAKVTLTVAGVDVLTLTAASAGAWGNRLRVDVDYGTSEPDTFNLTVSEVVEGVVLQTETFRNLALDEAHPRSVVRVVAHESKLIVASWPGATLPLQTGTPSKHIVDMSSLVFKEGSPPTQKKLKVNLIDVPITLDDPLTTPPPKTLPELATRLQQAIRRAHADLRNVTVSVVRAASGGYLRVKAGTDEAGNILELTESLALELGFQPNVQQYALGAAPGDEGADGGLPGAEDLQTALQKFDRNEIINLLSIPDTDQLGDEDAATVIAQATRYAESRRAFYIVDPPSIVDPLNPSGTGRDREAIEAWLDANGTLRHKNAAAYFPRVIIGDPLDQNRPRAIPNSGTLAGLYARTDVERGVWKAPAGIEATLRVLRLEHALNDAENGILNPRGLNSLRTFTTSGNVSWGARTLVGADQLTSEWKYVPVRRLALFLEESLFRGTQFAVFEPNDEPLWAQIRLNVGSFMQRLFAQGAFQGKTPREAYFVKCDRETTTQADIDLGIVNIIVGFAPLKPAEFVILKFTQIAGATQV